MFKKVLIKALLYSDLLVEVHGVHLPDDGEDAAVEPGGELGLGDDGRDLLYLLLAHQAVTVLVIQPEDYLEGKYTC